MQFPWNYLPSTTSEQSGVSNNHIVLCDDQGVAESDAKDKCIADANLLKNEAAIVAAEKCDKPNQPLKAERCPKATATIKCEANSDYPPNLPSRVLGGDQDGYCYQRFACTECDMCSTAQLTPASGTR